MKKLLLFCFVFLGIHFLHAQVLTLPPKIDLFQYNAEEFTDLNMSEHPFARLWGWSNNGRVAYSIEWFVDGRGGRIIDFVILDLITDNTIYELRMDSYDHDDYDGDYSYEDLFLMYNHLLADALQANNIVLGQTNDFLSFPFRRNNITYDSQIVDLGFTRDEYGMFERVVSRYSVLVTADNRRKIISNTIPVSRLTPDVHISGYFLSPFENRIMVVTTEMAWGFEGIRFNYRFNGCHLGVGFN